MIKSLGSLNALDWTPKLPGEPGIYLMRPRIGKAFAAVYVHRPTRVTWVWLVGWDGKVRTNMNLDEESDTSLPEGMEFARVTKCQRL